LTTLSPYPSQRALFSLELEFSSSDFFTAGGKCQSLTAGLPRHASPCRTGNLSVPGVDAVAHRLLLVVIATGVNNARAMAVESNHSATASNLRWNAVHQPLEPAAFVSSQLFRFSLKHLFWFIALASLLMTGMVSLHGLNAAVFLLATLVIIVHVSATTIATRLRSESDERRDLEKRLAAATHGRPSEIENSARLAVVREAPRSPWHARGSTALPWLWHLVLVAVILGAGAGMLFLTIRIGDRTSAAGVVVGSLSMAVLSGWFAFLCGSFYGVFRHGFRDAIAEPKQSERRGSEDT
jgi:hypothetical protein